MRIRQCLLASALTLAVSAPAWAQTDNMSKLQQFKTTGTSLDIPQIEQGGAKAAQLQENLKKVKAWIHLDGTYDIGPGPRTSDEEAQEGYVLSRCMSCGCCLEVCPQVNANSRFMGPAVMSQVVLFNSHPSGAMHAHERLDAVMGPGGIADCGKAQNCVRACPKDIPLTESLVRLARETTLHGIKELFRK